MFKALHPIAYIPLLACSANSKEPPKTSPITVEPISLFEAGGFLCDEKSAESYIGHKADAELAKTILSVTGAKILRWVPPRVSLSKDNRINRINIAYDENYIITSIRCG